jgi:hypothetical protein
VSLIDLRELGARVDRLSLAIEIVNTHAVGVVIATCTGLTLAPRKTNRGQKGAEEDKPTIRIAVAVESLLRVRATTA